MLASENVLQKRQDVADSLGPAERKEKDGIVGEWHLPRPLEAHKKRKSSSR
jgi:hypothetical protein